MKYMANNGLEKYIKTYMEMEQLISESKNIKIGDLVFLLLKEKKEN